MFFIRITAPGENSRNFAGMPIRFVIHSPEQQLFDPLLRSYGVELWFKRDDMIHPFISGNKWRKLKFPVNRLVAMDSPHLVTFGGAWSNHLLACAAAGAEFGFQTTAFVRGEPIDNPVLSMCRLFGMALRFVDRTSYRDKETLFKKHFEPEKTFFLDEGGYSPESVKGCAELVGELKNTYQHIVVPAGTGTTAAGIQQGLAIHRHPAVLHAVAVLKGASFLRDEIHRLGVNPAPIRFHWDYHFSGYGKVKPELIRFIREFVSRTGILIEPTYTGKMVYAAYDLIRKKDIPSGSRVLLIHTGGLTGLLGHLGHFSDGFPNPGG